MGPDAIFALIGEPGYCERRAPNGNGCTSSLTPEKLDEHFWAAAFEVTLRAGLPRVKVHGSLSDGGLELAFVQEVVAGWPRLDLGAKEGGWDADSFSKESW